MKGGDDKIMFSKKLLIPVFAVVVVGSTLIGVSTTHAQGGKSPFSGLAQAIATSLGVDQSKVQSAITAYMQQQKGNGQQNMAQIQKKRLDQLVSQGKITTVQETAILNELATLKNQNNPSSFQNMTQAQRQQAMQDQKNAITSWASSHGINPAYVMPFGGGRRGGWHKPTGTPTPTP
jgi:hypothetical protein